MPSRASSTGKPSVAGAESPATAVRPGRPRDPAADRAILDSVLRLLGQGCGFEALSMDLVANNAGVARATIYRRWRNKEALVLAALAHLDPPVAAPMDLPVRDALVCLVDQVRHRGEGNDLHRILAGLLGEAIQRPQLLNAYEETVAAARRAAIRLVLLEGVASGELAADLDVEEAVELLIGPMLARLILRQQQVLSTRFAEFIVDTFLFGAACRQQRHD